MSTHFSKFPYLPADQVCCFYTSTRMTTTVIIIIIIIIKAVILEILLVAEHPKFIYMFTRTL
jgi:hypothetical protein